jgi:hypothetical protein
MTIFLFIASLTAICVTYLQLAYFNHFYTMYNSALQSAQQPAFAVALLAALLSTATVYVHNTIVMTYEN